MTWPEAFVAAVGIFAGTLLLLAVVQLFARKPR